MIELFWTFAQVAAFSVAILIFTGMILYLNISRHHLKEEYEKAKKDIEQMKVTILHFEALTDLLKEMLESKPEGLTLGERLKIRDADAPLFGSKSEAREALSTLDELLTDPEMNGTTSIKKIQSHFERT